jgi:transcriptional regulator with XRE-family HTH domain
MAWEKVNLKEWANDAGLDINEIDQKLKLREMIIKLRNGRGFTQSELASIIGVSRSRIAQIESGVKLQNTSFDVLLRILQRLGYQYSIVAKKLAA